MDLLIKNMEMPKSCLGELTGKNDCPIVGICPVFSKTPFGTKEKECWNRRLDGCLLVEVRPIESSEDVMKKKCYVEVDV